MQVVTERNVFVQFFEYPQYADEFQTLYNTARLQPRFGYYLNNPHRGQSFALIIALYVGWAVREKWEYPKIFASMRGTKVHTS